jgi:hypothetical protein
MAFCYSSLNGLKHILALYGPNENEGTQRSSSLLTIMIVISENISPRSLQTCCVVSVN